MIHKRPFCDEESFEFPCKHHKQWEYTSHFAPVTDNMPSNDIYQNLQTSGDNYFGKCHDRERFTFQSDAEVSNRTENGFGTGSTGCIPQFWWASEDFVETDSPSDASLNLSLFPEYFAPGHQLRTSLSSDETYSSLFDGPPIRTVSVGPEYQADIPDCCSQGSKDTFIFPVNEAESVKLSELESGNWVDHCDEDRWMGTCVVPMPDLDDSETDCCANLSEISCECSDQGSIRCVRQHVLEAREKVRANLGQKTFEELGFCHMGEGVSEKWTVEEEQEFHDIVCNNPLSMDKNFWDKLSTAFPSRTKKDVVSYYFNVFMLRKRTEQNRFDPVNIDSDNDEWERSEEEDSMEEEDEDSGVESLNNQYTSVFYHDEDAENCCDDTAGVYEADDCQDDGDIHHIATDKGDGGDVDYFLGPHVGNSYSNSAGETGLQLLSKINDNNQEDCYIQDESCTSYEDVQEKVDCFGASFTGCDGKLSTRGSD